MTNDNNNTHALEKFRDLVHEDDDIGVIIEEAREEINRIIDVMSDDIDRRIEALIAEAEAEKPVEPPKSREDDAADEDVLRRWLDGGDDVEVVLDELCRRVMGEKR